MSAPGSATLRSPSIAERRRYAAGRRIGEDGDVAEHPASRSRPSAALTFAICMSERMPSCMRAPPDARHHDSGKPLGERSLRQARRASRRPPSPCCRRGSRSRTRASATGGPRSCRSRSPRLRCARCAREPRRCAVGYGSESRKPSGSAAVQRRRRSPRRSRDRRAARGAGRPSAADDGRTSGRR